MIDRQKIESIPPPKVRNQKVAYDSLMFKRIRNILLVSSQYDSFTFEEDGRFTQMLISQYLELNLRYVPNIVRVSTASAALKKLGSNNFDLVITMLRIGDMEVAEFGREIAKLRPGLPVVLLTYNTREMDLFENLCQLPYIDRVFVWLGDVHLFLAIIKYLEDRLNMELDSRNADVQCIILIEDNPRFYSSYLPMLYTELMQQTQMLMSDGLNIMDKLLRMRARPKVLLATTFEEGEELYRAHKEHVCGVILDAAFPRNGKMDKRAGIEFAKMVKHETPDSSVLIQSSALENEKMAKRVGALFVDKQSREVLGNLRQFMQAHLGFGVFVFRLPNGDEIGRASDMRSLVKMLGTIPAESLAHHVGHNHFSTWLRARTEFDLADLIRPRQLDEFNDIEAMRSYLINEFERHQDRSRAGVISDFSRETFKASSGFVRIGSGSLGGKGRGLAFMHTLLGKHNLSKAIPGVHIYVPPTAVIGSKVFDEVMQRPGLAQTVFADITDGEVAKAFLAAKLPDTVLENLRTFIQRTRYPLAVRSSSLLEDSSHQPFAGVYRTYMIPNNDPDLENRLRQLAKAIRLVYASIFYSDAKAYIESTPNRLEEEKMAVIIQEVVGRRRGDYLYPDIAGVARSYNFYPMDGMLPEEGTASVVLGLGKKVVDGGKCLRFSPAQPHRLYQFASAKDTLHSAQRRFLAMNMKHSPDDTAALLEEQNLQSLDLDVAEKDGVLPYVGSTYSAENDAVYDGTSRPGPKLITMAGVLKAGVYPLAETLSRLLEVGHQGFSCHVEIEFAANIRENKEQPHEFAFLQIRPVVVDSYSTEVNLDTINPKDTVCVSTHALGNGIISDVHDLVYVPMETFERGKTFEVAEQIGSIARVLKAEQRPYLLIGPGRWGSADKWLGIPVSWKQISGVRCIVETDMSDIRVRPSQGTHFFQNITSFGIGYFTVNFGDMGGMLDFDWLNAQVAETETEHVRHLHFNAHLEIAINGRKGSGVIMKPGHNLMS
jgi:hypothetical protein